jgi:type IV fimbrial biogenesis protein FimT
MRPARPGFTLIEILVVVIILGVVLALAVPSFTGAVNGSRLAGTANELLASLKQARAEAVRRNQRVVVCPTINGTTCATNWSQGWLVFEDANRDDGVSGGEEVISVATPAAGTQVRPSPAISGTHRIRYSPDGFARAANRALLNGTFAVCRPVTQPADNVRDLTLTGGSRTSIQRRAAAGACVDPSDP